MPDHRIAGDSSEQDRDGTVLEMLLCGPSWPWSVDEIARELQNPTAAADAVRRLTEAGLVHRLDQFVFPTRACRRAEELQVGTV
jgi:predicted transcriptional regulator